MYSAETKSYIDVAKNYIYECERKYGSGLNKDDYVFKVTPDIYSLFKLEALPNDSTMVGALRKKLLLNNMYLFGILVEKVPDYSKSYILLENKNNNHRSFNATIIKYSNCKSPKLEHRIEKVIFNDPATIVFWNDGTKTVVKCSEDDTFDKEKGLAMAILKKLLKDDYKKIFKKWCPEEEKEEIKNIKTRAVNEAAKNLQKLGYYLGSLLNSGNYKFDEKERIFKKVNEMDEEVVDE